VTYADFASGYRCGPRSRICTADLSVQDSPEVWLAFDLGDVSVHGERVLDGRAGFTLPGVR
jgi:hypothetical protein